MKRKDEAGSLGQDQGMATFADYHEKFGHQEEDIHCKNAARGARSPTRFASQGAKSIEDQAVCLVNQTPKKEKEKKKQNFSPRKRFCKGIRNVCGMGYQKRNCFYMEYKYM